MGAILGTLETRGINLNMDDKPTFEPNKGFAFKRRERVSCADPKELISAKIPPKYRDYCADYLLNYQVCRYKNFPWLLRCHHEKHDYLKCEKDDYVLRMKEFERERRLRERAIRLKNRPPCWFIFGLIFILIYRLIKYVVSILSFCGSCWRSNHQSCRHCK